MQFLYPFFLWALILLAIPIIIHLFYFRRFKKVYFTNVRFLKEVKEETSARNKLKNLIVLLSRILALSFLIFAFAQPFIPQSEDNYQGAHAITVFVDNSFSMNALSEDVPLFDKAKDRARQIVQAYTEEDHYNIITHDLEGKHMRLVSKKDALSFIDELTVSPEVKPINQILQRQNQLLQNTNDKRRSYLISDFQQNITDLSAFTDTSMSIYILPLQSVQEKNVSIDSAWFVAPVPMINQVNEMIIKLSNYGNTETENVQLNLLYEGQNRPLGIVSIAANSSTTDTIRINIQNPGWHTAEIQILDYPVQFDNTYHFAFLVDEETKVLAIHENTDNPYLTAAFRGLNYFSLTNRSVNQLSYGELPEYDLIILNELRDISSGLSAVLTSFIENGGNVLIFPGIDINISSYNKLLSQIPANVIEESQNQRKEVGYINTEEFIFKNVYESLSRNLKLPVTESNYKMSDFQRSTEEKLLSYRDGSSFLSKYTKGSGYIFVCSAPIREEDNDLVRNAEIFIPMLFKMAISTGDKQKIAYFIGKDNLLETDNILSSQESIFSFRGDEEFIPGQVTLGPRILLDLKNQLKTAGFYDLVLDEDVLSQYAFNYDRIESDLSYYSAEVLKESIDNNNVQIISASESAGLTNFIQQENKGIVLWKWCILFVLIFLLLEVLLLRFWKT